MSKQPHASRERLRLLRQELALPGDPRQLWLLVRMEPMDNRPGEFFVTHAKNFSKFEKRKGFAVIAHSHDRVALTIAANQATKAAGPAYQPKLSAFALSTQQAKPKPLPQGTDMGLSLGDEPSTPERDIQEEPEQ